VNDTAGPYKGRRSWELVKKWLAKHGRNIPEEVLDACDTVDLHFADAITPKRPRVEKVRA
jgi:hypothetical protein